MRRSLRTKSSWDTLSNFFSSCQCNAFRATSKPWMITPVMTKNFTLRIRRIRLFWLFGIWIILFVICFRLLLEQLLKFTDPSHEQYCIIPNFQELKAASLIIVKRSHKIKNSRFFTLYICVTDIKMLQQLWQKLVILQMLSTK